MGRCGRRTSLARRLGVGVLGLALIATARPVAAAPAATSETQRSDSATMLELDGKDKVLAARLGHALRVALAKRGLDNGRRDSLVELRLAMGCERDQPECLAKGGEALGVRRLIYGTLHERGGDQVLELSALVVESARLESSVHVTLSPSELSESAIDRTAERVVVELLKEHEPAPLDVTPAGTPAPVVDRSVPPPPPPPPSSSSSSDAEEPPPNKIWWGLERPTPRWKWVAFGTSAGLLLVSSATAIALRVRVVRLRDEVVDAANRSLQDVFPPGDPRAGEPNTFNDVDPTAVNDICASARENPDAGGNPNAVRNKKVTELCNRGDGLAKGTIASLALVGVTLASTLVFTGLLLIHGKRRSSNADARVRMSFGPTARGFGAAMSGRF